VGHEECTNKMRNTCNNFAKKPEGNTGVGRHRCRWKYNIKIDLKETGYDGVGWVQNRHSGGLF
jgi:hypothetical protein